MSSKHRIVFYLTDNEYQCLVKKAEACSMSVNAYAKQRTLDETDAVHLRRGAASTMTKLYYWAEQTTDLTAREYLRSGGDMLCRSLR